MPEMPDVEKLVEKNISLEKTIEKLLKENRDLKEIKKYYDTLMENTEDYVLICDKDATPQAFNASYKKVVERLLGIEMKPGIRPFDISDLAKAKAGEYWGSLQKRALNGEKFVAEYTDAEDENSGYFETIFCPVKEGEEVTGFTEITRNITAHKKTEKALEESNSFRFSLLEHAPIAILVYDPDTTITYVNSSFEKLTGFTKEEILGIKAPYPWWTDEMVYDPIKQRKKGFEPVHKFERRQRNKNGEYSWVEIDTAPIYHNGELSHILAMWVDVTERKKYEHEKSVLQEKLQRSLTMESLGLLAGGVAHDLNNVLAGIVSYPELLLSDMPEDNRLRKPLKVIKDAGDRATAIVQDLLTIARGVATKKTIININNLINEYLESPEFEKLKQYHPLVDIKTDLDSELFNIKGSDIHLRKVLMNLISNAAEAIDGSGNITISTKNTFLETPVKEYDYVETGEYTILSVVDNGPGISSEDLKRIFEPFYTKKVMGRSGTGLGLSVVWNIIREHNGYINVISDKEGTRFEVYFPIIREDLSDIDPEISLERIRGNGQKILIIDDVHSQRYICRKILEKLGYKVSTVSSGEEAVEYLKDETADLVLLDMIMAPGINGLETYKSILKINPHQKATIMSGYSANEEVKKTQELGAGGFIKKPVTMQSLGMAIKEELN